jgi:hypothetical protein
VRRPECEWRLPESRLCCPRLSELRVSRPWKKKGVASRKKPHPSILPSQKPRSEPGGRQRSCQVPNPPHLCSPVAPPCCSPSSRRHLSTFCAPETPCSCVLHCLPEQSCHNTRSVPGPTRLGRRPSTGAPTAHEHTATARVLADVVRRVRRACPLQRPHAAAAPRTHALCRPFDSWRTPPPLSQHPATTLDPPGSPDAHRTCAAAPLPAIHEPSRNPPGQRHLVVFDPAASAPDLRRVRLPPSDPVMGRVEGVACPPVLGQDRVAPPVLARRRWLGFGVERSTRKKRRWEG